MKFNFNNQTFFLLKGFFKNLFFGFVIFCLRIKKSVVLMTRFEKYIAILFLVISFILLGVKGNNVYKEMTKPVPGYGGSYKEAVVGEVRYINPILASTDAEKSVSGLLFSGLLRFDKSNNIIPEVAKNWEISPDNLKYTFTLRDDVFFDNGMKLTAIDVVYTVDTIKNPDFKSPLYNAWKDVNVSTEGDDKVVFQLPKVYGPFIYNCDFGILPSQLSPDDFSKKAVGSGAYRYSDVKKENNKITKIFLTANNQYFKGKPFINSVELDLFSKSESKAIFQGNEYTAYSGDIMDNKDLQDLAFTISKQLALIPNLRKDVFKNNDFRKKVLSDQKFDTEVSLTLSTLDSEVQRQKAEELKNQLASRNIILKINYYSSSELKNILDKKDFELLLYGFDFGNDRDPYVSWHSSQVDKLNFAGYSDKISDILLEDARMTTDNNQRITKYDQFFKTVSDNSLALFFSPLQYNFYVDKDVKGISAIIGNDVGSKYYGIEKWYINEKRVRK